MVGIIPHSSLFPRTWCYAEKKYIDKRGLIRTLGNSLKNYIDWREAGAVEHLLLGTVKTLFSHMLEEFEKKKL